MKRKAEFNFERDAKVLIFDLEVSASLMYAHGYYEPKVVKVVEQPKLLSVAWKWLGEDKVYCETIAKYNEIGKNDDSALVRKLWSLLDECSVAVAYNGNQFDNKVANTFFVEQGLNPPSPYKQFDPLQTARRFFRFGSNRLDYVGKLLNGLGKTEKTYGDCWEDLMFGDKKARKAAEKLMVEYNSRDVECLERVYLKLRPWAHNHPNMALASGHDFVCPRCGKAEGFRISKYRYSGTQITGVQVQCQSCGSYVTRPLDGDEKEALAEKGMLKAVFRNTTP